LKEENKKKFEDEALPQNLGSYFNFVYEMKGEGQGNEIPLIARIPRCAPMIKEKLQALVQNLLQDGEKGKGFWRF